MASIKNLCALVLVSMAALSSAVANTGTTTPGVQSGNTASSEPKREGGLGGFLKSLNKKSSDLKNAVENAAGNTKADGGTPSQSTWSPVASRSAAPIFDNDSSSRTSDERVQEVLSRGGEWGDLGSNTSGYITINPAIRGTLQGLGTLTWGASKSTCIAFVTERGGTILDSTKDRPGVEILSFRGGSFAGQVAQAWQLHFYKDRLFDARVEYVYPKGNVLREYRRMLASLESKYGGRSGEQDLRFLYLDLDVNYESKKWNSRDDEAKHWFYLMRLDAWYAQALAAQSAQPMSKWQFDGGDTLTLWISGRSKVMLHYLNGALANDAAEFAKKTSSTEKDL